MVIKKDDFLFGIRYWAQWYTQSVPRYEVFRYVGSVPDAGMYYFQSVKNQCVIARSFYQLNSSITGFKPLVLDYKRIQHFVNQGGTHANF